MIAYEKFPAVSLSLLFFSVTAAAGELIVSSGTSSNLATVWGEAGNKSGAYSLRYAGDRFGVRIDKSVHGDDAGNQTLTGDVLTHPFGGFVLGAGLAKSEKRLRGIGETENFHALIGFELSHLIAPRVGAGVWFDHWSNGRRLFGRPILHNPPRNVMSVGVSFAL